MAKVTPSSIEFVRYMTQAAMADASCSVRSTGTLASRPAQYPRIHRCHWCSIASAGRSRSRQQIWFIQSVRMSAVTVAVNVLIQPSAGESSSLCKAIVARCRDS